MLFPILLLFNVLREHYKFTVSINSLRHIKETERFWKFISVFIISTVLRANHNNVLFCALPELSRVYGIENQTTEYSWQFTIFWIIDMRGHKPLYFCSLNVKANETVFKSIFMKSSEISRPTLSIPRSLIIYKSKPVWIQRQQLDNGSLRLINQLHNGALLFFI